MAPFTKREVGYIKAIAGIGQQKSFINYSNAVPTIGWTGAHVDPSLDGSGEFTNKTKFPRTPMASIVTVGSRANFAPTKALAAACYCLNQIPLTVDHTDTLAGSDVNDALFQQSKFRKFVDINPMFLLSSANIHEGDETKNLSSTLRVGEDFYVESTHIRWRFTMPDFTVATGKQPHHEYRFIVFRQRKPTVQRDGVNNGRNGQWLNWNYDLFSGYEGRRVGFEGYRAHEQLDGNEGYYASPVSVTTAGITSIQQRLETDDIMTMPLNDADYVIMRDERFFLGAEHGKSHYETVTRFDWTDPGSTSDYNMVLGMDESKNYDWFFLILGTTNDTEVPQLNIAVRGTTAVTSA